MIKQGSIVRYKGENERFYNGQLLMVHERKDDLIKVWIESKKKKNWDVFVLNIAEVEEVC